jgi:hypothetical protein
MGATTEYSVFVLETSLEEALLLVVLLLSAVNQQYQGEIRRGLDCLLNSSFLDFLLLICMDFLHEIVFSE